MNDVALFTFETHSVRSVLVDGDPWFVAADVCAVLGIGRPQDSVRYLDEDERGRCPVDTPSGQQEALIVNEPGLYSLILRSRRPEARAFKRWVTHEVLPALRRTGRYGLPDLSTPEGVLAMAEQLTATARELVASRRQVAQLAPKAAAADALLDAEGTVKMGALANMLGIGRTKLFRLLYDEGVLQRDKRPYQRYAAWFRVVMSTHETSAGTKVVDYTAHIYPEGAVRLHALLSRRGHRLRAPRFPFQLTLLDPRTEP